MKILSFLLLTITILSQSSFAKVNIFSVKLFKNKVQAEKEMKELKSINLQSYLLTTKEVVLDGTEFGGYLQYASNDSKGKSKPVYMVIGSNEDSKYLSQLQTESQLIKLKVFSYGFEADNEYDALTIRHMRAMLLRLDTINYMELDSSLFGGSTDRHEVIGTHYITIGTK